MTKGIHDERDPRTTLDDESLEEASTNRFPVVANQKRGKDGFAIWGGMFGAVALGALTLYLMSEARQSASPQPKQAEEMPAIADLQPPPVPQNAVTLVDPLGNSVMGVQPSTVPSGQGVPPVTPPPMATVLPPPTTNFEPRTTDPRSPALILDDYADRLQRRNANRQASAGEVPTTPIGLNNDELFGMRAGEGGSSSATPMANPGATIVAGTLIPAVLETAINSDLPGYTRAFVSQDVRSFDNKTVLLPRGSRLIGQYKSGVAAGQKRAYVIWTRAIRPDGISIDLGSPGTDGSGQTGLPGKVNSHFFQRFGAAILLSVVGALGSRSNDGVVIASGTSAASVAAQSSANIPPTIRVVQGQAVKIFVARDLDFTDALGANL
ncbi:type VI secretion protein [Sphingorhabdus contaminans]|uniref:Type VI secretion protein n=1 Tax=Sphingorhabdus contaminans TaxID=1343899 RepID=A0A553WD44_9SPHN|nr:type VI secretion protein [Sphingorhabdus contaminans]